MSLKWRGPQVLEKMKRAEVTGINATMAQAVEHAKRNHAWINRTGTLEGSIAIAEFAVRIARGARGLWGSKDVVYALIHELGGTITAKAGGLLKFKTRDGAWHAVKSVTIKARPYLRPAADATYRNLTRNIKRAFARP